MNEPNLAPLSALNQLLYCPHRAYLLHRCGEMEANAYVWDGRRLHRRADAGGAETRNEGGRTVLEVRARPVSSEALGIRGVIDLVSFPSDGAPLVVETKRGRAPDGEGVWPNDATQVCAQILCLEEELGLTCADGVIFYAGSGARRTFSITPELRARTRAACARLARILRGEETPAPEHGLLCEGCSVHDICLPEATASAASGIDPWESPS